jgi:hypothetical protein
MILIGVYFLQVKNKPSLSEHKLNPESVRTSTSPGHFVAGVYDMGTNKVTW